LLLKPEKETGKDMRSKMISDNAGITLAGNLEAGLDLRLVPDRKMEASVWIESPCLDVQLAELVKVDGLESHLRLSKAYILEGASGRAVASGGRTSLSHRVLQPSAGRGPYPAAYTAVAARFIHDSKGRLSGPPTLSVNQADIFAAGPAPIVLDHSTLRFRMDQGLPIIDHFQVELFGGTVAGSLLVTEEDGSFWLGLNVEFSGVDAQQILPNTTRGLKKEETEISGYVTLFLPLATTMDQILEGLRAEVALTHVGSRAFERILYSMDPYESNEAIVSQRRMLRMGNLRWVRVMIRDGNLSVAGEIQAKGARLPLPSIERVNIARLPGVQSYEDSLSALGPVLRTLTILSADRIELTDEGQIRFTRKE